MLSVIIISALTTLSLWGPTGPTVLPVPITVPVQARSEQLLASHELNLADRQPDPWVNSIFADNILLNMAYVNGKVTSVQNLNWDEVRQPFHYEFRLEPGQTFAYHSDILPQYQGRVVKTTNAHFNSQEGFKSDGYLVGDGVCHLASLINWVAKDAALNVYAPTNHDFAKINGVDKKFGVAIYSSPLSRDAGAMQNLYITNNRGNPVEFRFDYDGKSELKLTVVELD